ncbi:MAG: phosphate ABC transporter substrate-binding protein [Planctomycetes bacterium]|nr:phosphate ABC transporter substrate-binding protein [Planctomycetota bacterium]
MIIRQASVLTIFAVLVPTAAGPGCQNAHDIPIIGLFVPESRPAKDPDRTAFVVNGSTTAAPVVKAFAEHFKGKLDVTLKETGSGEGIARLISGHHDIASSSRNALPEEIKQAGEKGVWLVPHPVALDATCVIVHPSNPVKGLTVRQIHDIYTGKITNWNQVGGADKPIRPVSQENTRTSYLVFKSYILGGDWPGLNVKYVRKAQVLDLVAGDEAAICYHSLGKVNPKVKAIEINGVAPTPQTVRSRQYLLIRPIFLMTDGYPKVGSPIYEFVTFAMGKEGQKIVQDLGFVPLMDFGK